MGYESTNKARGRDAAVPKTTPNATNCWRTVMAERQCPECKCKDITVMPIADRSARQMGVGYANTPLGIAFNLAKVVAGYTIYPWLKCRRCGKEWRQFESPL